MATGTICPINKNLLHKEIHKETQSCTEFLILYATLCNTLRNSMKLRIGKLNIGITPEMIAKK